MNAQIGTSGLIFNEPQLWDKSIPGRCGISIPTSDLEKCELNKELVRDSADLPELSELDVIRHYTRLSQWNFGVDSGMYPLGSCTMKYNPKTNEVQASKQEIACAHPLSGDDNSQGALKLMYELQVMLAEITGMHATTLQPAAGAHGELAGMLIIHAFHAKNGKQRSKIIIPDTAHGTNPASATLCGYESINISSDENGVLTPEAVAEVMDEDTAGIMITNPNTLGLFEEHMKEIADVVHAKGGLVYGDGANMNAIMGYVKPGEIGIDVLHLNLHKTFATPHGGGGPGSGPVVVTKELEPFLPVPVIVKNNNKYAIVEDKPDSIGRMHTFYGHFNVMVKAYSYILSMGATGLKKVSEYSVLNANYIKECLRDELNLPYDRPCMHECVFNDEKQAQFHITTMDMAKRLLDLGFHPPTVYFPLVVAGAFMVEPTETESKQSIDEFINAVKTITKEAKENPEILHSAPNITKVSRLDEVQAARKPCLRG
ncbi:MAG: glycine dehydrogenase subunit 2 [Desulfobacteraceae bacterium]|nr:glycine dehydrogenase subunit 2 [Desulfobacteraceae bacterium]